MRLHNSVLVRPKDFRENGKGYHSGLIVRVWAEKLPRSLASKSGAFVSEKREKAGPECSSRPPLTIPLPKKRVIQNV